MLESPVIYEHGYGPSTTTMYTTVKELSTPKAARTAVRRPVRVSPAPRMHNDSSSNSGASVTNDGDSSTRRVMRKHHKVRTGCEQCKARKVKCDEARPACNTCISRRHVCVYRQKASNYPLFGCLDAEGQSVVRFSAKDLGLWHHWSMATAGSIGASEELRTVMRDALPVEALDKPYLLHTVLALSARHVADLKREQRTVYELLGKHHYDQALPLFRANLPLIEPDNCHALYACSQLIVKYLFAAESRPERFFFAPEAEAISLIRGAFLVRETYKDWLKRGPLGCCARDIFDERTDELPSPYDEQLSRLSKNLPLLSIDALDVADSRAALGSLRHLLGLTTISPHVVSSKGLCQAWMSRASAQFFANVRLRKPVAVVVLAHYCLLLKSIDGPDNPIWYMRGWRKAVFEECVRNLDESAMRHVEWLFSVFE